jgi:hypothetical protein
VGLIVVKILLLSGIDKRNFKINLVEKEARVGSLTPRRSRYNIRLSLYLLRLKTWQQVVTKL